MLLKLLIAIASILSISLGQVTRYDNFTLYRVTPLNSNDLNILADLQKSGLYDFWTNTKNVGTPVDILVSLAKVSQIQKVIENHKIGYEILSSNIQEQIDEEYELNARRFNSSIKAFNWLGYHQVNEIYDWLRSLAKTYPNIVQLVEGGISYEGRQILGVKVSFKKGNEKRGVWLDSLIHAREWISGATNTYILNELLTSTDPKVRRIAESHDWYVFPVLNPDGYEHSHTRARLWRKTRRPYSILCYGADPNRNWGYKWNTGGASNNPCDDTYAGPRAFSEIETESLSQYITSIASNLKVFISFHSYTQVILLPYGYTYEYLDNYNEAKSIGEAGAASLAKRYGTQYQVGSSTELMYIASGGSDDWVKGTFKTPIVFCFELRDTGTYGFLLPPSQIIPTGEETLDALLTVLDKTDEYYP